VENHGPAARAARATGYEPANALKLAMDGTPSRSSPQCGRETGPINIFFHSQVAAVVLSESMRTYLLFPLAFVSGIYGFILFAPYLIAVVALGHLVRSRRAALVTVGREVKRAVRASNASGALIDFVAAT